MSSPHEDSMNSNVFDRRSFVYGVCLCLLAAPSSAEETQPPAPDRVIFYAMGDVPYDAFDDELLPKQIANIPNDAAFIIHVGDIKRAFVPCFEGVYAKVAGMLQKSRAPLFIIPGDNEWNDCLNPAGGWKLWEKHFLRFEQQWQHQIPVFRSLEREENFSFVIKDTLFIGLNLVGGRVHDREEWRLRHQQNLDWVKKNIDRNDGKLQALVLFGHAHPNENHEDFFEPFLQIATSFTKPILYLHGDGHKWLHDRPFKAKNIERVQVDQGGKAPPLKISIFPGAEQPFQFDRRMDVADPIPSND